jgi:hypothetical protein
MRRRREKERDNYSSLSGLESSDSMRDSNESFEQSMEQSPSGERYIVNENDSISDTDSSDNDYGNYKTMRSLSESVNYDEYGNDTTMGSLSETLKYDESTGRDSDHQSISLSEDNESGSLGNSESSQSDIENQQDNNSDVVERGKPDNVGESLADKESKPTPTRERKIITCLTLFLSGSCLIAALGVGIAIGMAVEKTQDTTLSLNLLPVSPSITPSNTQTSKNPSESPVPINTIPTFSPISTKSPLPAIPTQLPTRFSSGDSLLDLLILNSFDKGSALLTTGTPQQNAYLWLSNNTNLDSYSEEVKLARYALATFFYSTNGQTTWNPKFRNDGWITDAPECDWASTANNQCTNGVYTSLTLDFVGASGQIPQELGLLTGLKRLSLRGEGIGSPSISGSVPESIGALVNVETIRLNDNNIGGTLPTTVGMMTNMRVFLLSGNSIEGSIPKELGLTRGSTFNFDRNQITGTIPRELFAMGTLTAMNFEENFLTGNIASQIGLNPRLNSLNFARNNLTGKIPTEIGRLVTMKGRSFDGLQSFP